MNTKFTSITGAEMALKPTFVAVICSTADKCTGNGVYLLIKNLNPDEILIYPDELLIEYEEDDSKLGIKIKGAWCKGINFIPKIDEESVLWLEAKVEEILAESDDKWDGAMEAYHQHMDKEDKDAK